MQMPWKGNFAVNQDQLIKIELHKVVPFCCQFYFFTVFAHAEDDFCNYEHLSAKSCHCCQEELLLCYILYVFMRVFQCEWKDARVGGQVVAVVWVWSTPWHSSTTRGPRSLPCAGPGFDERVCRASSRGGEGWQGRLPQVRWLLAAQRPPGSSVAAPCRWTQQPSLLVLLGA